MSVFKRGRSKRDSRWERENEQLYEEERREEKIHSEAYVNVFPFPFWFLCLFVCF